MPGNPLEIQQSLFLRFFARWKRHPFEYLMRELDSGKYDAELEVAAGRVAPAAPPRQFVDVTPFDTEDLAKCKGLSSRSRYMTEVPIGL